MKLFAMFQRVKRQPLSCVTTWEKARIFASGYIVDANGIDILNGFWALRLLSYSWAFDIRRLDYRFGQLTVMYTRQRGVFTFYDFDIAFK